MLSILTLWSVLEVFLVDWFRGFAFCLLTVTVLKEYGSKAGWLNGLKFKKLKAKFVTNRNMDYDLVKDFLAMLLVNNYRDVECFMDVKENKICWFEDSL